MTQAINSNEMSAAAREAQRAYNRKWAEKNKERRKEYNQRYWERKAAEAAERKD